MKILLVNCVYAYGSTGKIMAGLMHGLEQKGHDVRVCYGRGQTYDEPHTKKLAPEWVMQLQSLAGKLTGKPYECAPITTARLCSFIKEWKPDVVHLHCVNAATLSYAATIEWLKRHDVPTVVTCHAEFMYTGGCSHALSCDKWMTDCKNCPQITSNISHLPRAFVRQHPDVQLARLKTSFDGFRRLVVTYVSPWGEERIKRSAIFRNKRTMVVMNGVNTSIFRPIPASDIRCKTGVSPEQKIILHVTPDFHSEIKGGRYVTELARKAEALHPDWRIIIVGYRGNRSNLPSNILPMDFTTNAIELAQLYSAADVTLLCSEKETFSMVVAESLCCGTPVAGFKAGAPEMIAIPENSLFVEFGETDLLLQGIEQMIDMKRTKHINTSRAQQTYSIETMVCGYLNAYRTVLDNTEYPIEAK